MRNRYKGRCNVCQKEVLPKEGRWRETPKPAQNFVGLRCLEHSTTTKRNVKFMAEKGISI